MRHRKCFRRIAARKDLFVRAFLYGERRDRLGRIHGRTASDRDHKICPRALQERDPLPHACDGGIGRDAVKDGGVLSVSFQCGEHIVERAVQGRALPRDNQRVRSERFELIAVFRNTVPPADHAGRHVVGK